MRLASILCLLFVVRATQGFVYSCEEVKYKLLNGVTIPITDYACIVPQNGFTNFDQLRNIRVVSGQTSVNLVDLYNKTDLNLWNGCLLSSSSSSDWCITADEPVSLDCEQEFTLIFSAGSPINLRALLQPSSEQSYFLTPQNNQGLVSPRGGMRLRIAKKSTGDDTIDFFTGFGNGAAEKQFPFKSWRCSDIPTYIVSFDVAVSILLHSTTLGFYYETNDVNSEIVLQPGEKIAILTSGRSDNLQNLQPERNGVKFRATEMIQANISYSVSFDSKYQGNVTIVSSQNTKNLGNGTGAYSFTSNSFEVHYNTANVSPDQIWESDDFVVIEITTAAASDTTTTATTAPISDSGAYCACGLDRFYMSDGWDTKQIWLDVVIILDTSEAMGEYSLNDAASLIESFIGDDSTGYDVLITDSSAPFYTRVGLVSMSNKAEVLYNLNMTKYDKVADKAKIATGVAQINVMDAFDAALQMLNNAQPKRPDVRRVIYYMTNSDPGANLSPVNQFKASDGVIIVNNYLSAGSVEMPGLKDLASDGYYYTGIQENYMFTIQAFCKANCFCKADLEAYTGQSVDVANKAAGGCYHPVPSGVSFGKARQACTNNKKGLIASPHDTDKAAFLNKVLTDALPSPKPYFLWIGYSKIDDGATWKWEDGSSNSFTNWATGEPNSNPIAQCAYIDQSSLNLEWGAGNCQTGFPYVCEYAPCSVGNKDC